MKVVVLLMLVIVMSFSCSESKKEEKKVVVIDSTSIKDSIKKALEPKDLEIIGEVLPNKGFAEAILTAGQINDSVAVISNQDMLRIVMSLREEVDMRYIRAGEKFKIKFNKDTTKILSFEYYPNVITTHRLYTDSTDTTGTFETETVIKETAKKYKLIYGVLDTGSRTLDAALRTAGLPGNLTQTVNNIMVCKVSFRYDARLGDSAVVLVEEKVFDDEVVDATVLYASYKGRRAGFQEAYFYRDSDPKSSYNAYYTEDGRALVNNALRYPLDRIHVVSSYGYRIHPVTGRRAMHNGVDLRGRNGTPVYAAARGIVSQSYRSKYGGNTIAITHSDGTQSYYLHLSRRLARKGNRVVARQLIGKVGSTGRVTGPHLHFGIKTPQGRWVNPMRRRMIATPKLKTKRMKRLKEQMSVQIGLRDSLLAL